MDLSRVNPKLLFAGFIAAVLALAMILLFGPALFQDDKDPKKSSAGQNTGQNRGQAAQPSQTNAAPPAELPEPSPYNGGVSRPLSDPLLAAAAERGLGFVKVFGNSRWNDDFTVRLTQLRQYIQQAAEDDIVEAYRAQQPSAAVHEIVTFQVVKAEWAVITKDRVVMDIYGKRTFSSDSGVRTEDAAWSVTLVIADGKWLVSRIATAGEG